MNKLADQQYLLKDQYKDASNLNARIRLHLLYSTNPQGFWSWEFEQFDIAPDAKVLEVGCGPGTLWTDNAHRIPEGWDITLSDFSAGMLEEARANLSGVSHDFQYEVIDAQQIPYPDGSFDAVIANYMLYHVPDRAQAIAEMRRVLCPGGKLYAATIGQKHLVEIKDLVTQFAPQFVLDGFWEPAPADSAMDWDESFYLETGEPQLRGQFPSVQLSIYDDSMEITEAGPLVDYVMSTAARPVIESENLTRFTQLVEQEIARKGVLRVSKSTGVFEARSS